MFSRDGDAARGALPPRDAARRAVGPRRRPRARRQPARCRRPTSARSRSGRRPAGPRSSPIGELTARLVNGELTAEVEMPDRTGGHNEPDGALHCAPPPARSCWRRSASTSGGRARAPTSATARAPAEIHQQFRAYAGERLYGMGQRTHGRLDHKGLALDLVQRNAEVSIPFVLSSRGYGFLWNNPAVGRVEFAENHTRWTATQARAHRLLHHHRHAGGDPRPLRRRDRPRAAAARRGRAASGRASCATAARRRSSRSRASTAAAACRCR